MRIACWASTLALGGAGLAACTRDTGRSAVRAPVANVTAITARTDSGRTVLTWAGAAGASRSVIVSRDSTVAPSALPMGASVAGEIPDSVLVVVDSYPSRPGGMSYCQAGVERFLRVLSIAAAHPVETYRVKLASCTGNIELASDSTAWNAAASELRIHWLSGPNAAHAPDSATLRITGDGRVQGATP